MNNCIFIIAHVPLASALLQCVLHVMPDAGDGVAAFDVQPDTPPEKTLAAARQAMARLDGSQILVLTDVFGATPCNVAQKLADGVNSRLIAGVNLPMLLRTVNHRRESLDALAQRALTGGMQGVMQVALSGPRNQARKANDQSQHDHQQ